MDAKHTKIKKETNRTKYSKTLDVGLTDKQRNIAIAMLTAETTSQVAENAGVGMKSVYEASSREAVIAPTTSALLSKRAAADRILKFCEEILDKDAETALKHSDKLAAARLYAEISGAIKAEGSTTINVGIMDLRQASTEELVEELARIEQEKRNIIDVEPVE